MADPVNSRKMYRLLIHCLLVFSSLVYCDEEVKIEKDGHVLVFNENNFRAGLDLHENVLVEFCEYWFCFKICFPFVL